MAADLSSLRYGTTVDAGGEGSHGLVLSLVPPGSRVLELGPAAGGMTRELLKLGCEVTTVEFDLDAAISAAMYSTSAHVADLNTRRLHDVVADGDFDVVIAADVLEHLVRPDDVLTDAARLLRSDGICIVSLPNVAHGSVRLALLDGRFEYRSEGLLDRTHLRFYTRDSASHLLSSAGLELTGVHEVVVAIDASEIPFDRTLLSHAAGARVQQDADAVVYQFVLVGRMVGNPPATPPSPEAPTLDQAEALARRHLIERLEAAQQALNDHRRQLAERDMAIQSLREEAREKERKLADVVEELRLLERTLFQSRTNEQRLQITVDHVLSHPAYRGYAFFKRCLRRQ